MKNLTPEKCEELLDNLRRDGDNLSIREYYYMQALQMALDVLKEKQSES